MVYRLSNTDFYLCVKSDMAGLALLVQSDAGCIYCVTLYFYSMDEAADAIDDSDEEADYTKMDMGNKKGPVNRWDFENDEQYQEYMSKKEALPK